ncbi:hypothetical protein J2O02_18440 (plasmid) [Elizabethkingia anophelis]|uniref:DUF6876 family protein n=1 Tax=Elizabethkingia anophelis TaxID=1117645 RepID=UPI0020B653E6|nr:DUF6876 family protein [Elizabethkingia anophelis]UTG66801.1 hypothetical protein J2O02_18440 [Elizabethkingia anophelis]
MKIKLEENPKTQENGKEIIYDANNAYSQYIGSESLIKYFGKIRITEGVYSLSTEQECNRILNVIVSAQLSNEVKNEPFQVWRIERFNNTNRFIITCDDGGKWSYEKQEIFTKILLDRKLIFQILNLII